jgi:hypothetical protein
MYGWVLVREILSISRAFNTVVWLLAALSSLGGYRRSLVNALKLIGCDNPSPVDFSSAPGFQEFFPGYSSTSCPCF